MYSNFISVHKRLVTDDDGLYRICGLELLVRYFQPWCVWCMCLWTGRSVKPAVCAGHCRRTQRSTEALWFWVFPEIFIAIQHCIANRHVTGMSNCTEQLYMEANEGLKYSCGWRAFFFFSKLACTLETLWMSVWTSSVGNQLIRENRVFL